MEFRISCEQVCTSESFLDFARTEGHCGLTAVYCKHKLFQQFEIDGDVELQNTHIVHLECPRVVTYDAINHAENLARS